MFYMKSINILEGWSGVSSLKTSEDVATVLDMYERALGVFKPEDIVGVVEKNGYYAVVIDTEGGNTFDLFPWVNSLYKSDNEVTCVNAKFLYPNSISRGEYLEVDEREQGTGDFDDSDEAPTGFLDSDAPDIEKHYVHHNATGNSIPIVDERGVVFGRSSSRVEYPVDNSLMSRVHARIYKINGKYMVSDLGSKNGTFVDGLRVLQGRDAELSVGSNIRMADEMFKFI